MQPLVILTAPTGDGNDVRLSAAPVSRSWRLRHLDRRFITVTKRPHACLPRVRLQTRCHEPFQVTDWTLNLMVDVAQNLPQQLSYFS
jgi:hypothetical protein